jgi:hypothetical protein
MGERAQRKVLSFRLGVHPVRALAGPEDRQRAEEAHAVYETLPEQAANTREAFVTW